MLSNEIFDDLFHESKDKFEDNSSDLIFIQKYDVGLQMIRVCIRIILRILTSKLPLTS